MWLIMFQPMGSTQFVPQGLCYSEQEAKNWVQNAPFSAVGSYSYMYVPVMQIGNYWKRQEPYILPDYQFPYPPVHYYTTPERKQWQIEVGDWPDSHPRITC